MIDAIPPETASIGKLPESVSKITSGISIDNFLKPILGGNIL